MGLTALTYGWVASASASAGTRVLKLAVLELSPKPRPWNTVMVLVPKLLMLLKICCCDPFPKATTVTTEAIPIIMPSMVKKVRIRCAFIDKIAIRKASPKRSSRERHAETLLFFSCWAEIAVSASGSLCSSVSCSG